LFQAQQVLFLRKESFAQTENWFFLKTWFIWNKTVNLVYVAGHPSVGVDVEGHDVVSELAGGLQPAQLHIGATRPVGATVLVLTHIADKINQLLNLIFSKISSGHLLQKYNAKCGLQ
jgi:hypothetical protein